MTVARRRGLELAALCAAPFVIGLALSPPGAGGDGGVQLWPCPFRAITGVPCPLCGATRSVVLAVHGDGRYLDYNPWWVLVLIAGVVIGLAAAMRSKPPPRVPDRMLTAGLVAMLAVGWAVSLAHATAITR